MATCGYLICFRKRRESYSSKANRGFVYLQEREIRCKLPQRDNTKSWSNSGTDKFQAFATFDVYYHTGTCLCGSAAVRDSQQTISDLLPESHGCFGTGWFEFLLVATHQNLTKRCFGCEDWYSHGLGSWKHCYSQRLWSKPPGSKEASLEDLIVDLNGKPR